MNYRIHDTSTGLYHSVIVTDEAEIVDIAATLNIDSYSFMTEEEYELAPEYAALVAPSAKQLRDQSLKELTHDLGNGRIIQVRPQDEQNVRNAIEIMATGNIPFIMWVMEDNQKYAVTKAELEEALAAGQLAALQIWEDYTPD